MAVTRSQARLFAQLIAELEPRIRRAFMASVTDLQANVNWSELLSALQAQDVNRAIAALNISEAAFNEYASEMSDAYARAGASTAAQIQAAGIGGIGVRFNMCNPRAEEWIRRYVGESITGFTHEAVEVARLAIAEGYAMGYGPRTIALDLVGRAAPGGGRQGGVMGLDRPRAERLIKVTQGMRTAEGVQDLVIAHRDGNLSLKYKVNKATAQRILRAYRAGTEVPEAERRISERQYQNALLKARGDTVARTETGNAVMSARMEEWRQLTEEQGIDPTDVIKTWRHRGSDRNARPDHVAMNNTEVRGLYTPFVFPDGAELQYACDPNGGADHVINCRCDVEFRLDHSRGLQ